MGLMRTDTEFMNSGILIFLFAGFGATLRFFFSQNLNAEFPYGTLLVNLLGSIAMGWLMTQTHWPLSSTVKVALAAGFLGALTPYSSFAFELVQFIEKGKWAQVAVYVGLTQVLAVLGCFIGVRWARNLGM